VNSLDNNRCGVLAAGTWALDRISLVDQWPKQEHLANIISTDKQGGGCGYNLAINLKKLSPPLPVFAAGLLGADNDAQFLLNNATEHRIDVSQLHQTTQAPTAYTEVISANDTGKRTFFHHRGSSDLLTPATINPHACNARILHLGLLGLHARLDEPWQHYANGWVAVLAAARHAGLHTNLELVSIDAARIRQIAKPCLAHLDSLIVNEYELSALADMPVTDKSGTIQAELCANAAQAVLQQSSAQFLVVHYPAAALVLTNDGQRYYQLSLEVAPADIVSTVGAGDAFAAGFLFALHESWPMERALELAHAAAARSLRSATTVGSMCSWQECLKMHIQTEATY